VSRSDLPGDRLATSTSTGIARGCGGTARIAGGVSPRASSAIGSDCAEVKVAPHQARPPGPDYKVDNVVFNLSGRTRFVKRTICGTHFPVVYRPRTGGSPTTAGGSTATTGSTGGSNTASDTGVTADTIKIGLITALTGVTSSNEVSTPSAVEARFDAQNAAGGVNGRKLQLVTIDDQSTVAGDLTAAQNLVQQKKVFAVIGYSSFLFRSAKYLNGQGVPVVGSAFDGPEWGQQPYSNTFSYNPPASTPSTVSSTRTSARS
jgi:Periplasmic binding protein